MGEPCKLSGPGESPVTPYDADFPPLPCRSPRIVQRPISAQAAPVVDLPDSDDEQQSSLRKQQEKRVEGTVTTVTVAAAPKAVQFSPRLRRQQSVEASNLPVFGSISVDRPRPTSSTSLKSPSCVATRRTRSIEEKEVSDTTDHSVPASPEKSGKGREVAAGGGQAPTTPSSTHEPTESRSTKPGGSQTGCPAKSKTSEAKPAKKPRRERKPSTSSSSSEDTSSSDDSSPRKRKRRQCVGNWDNNRCYRSLTSALTSSAKYEKWYGEKQVELNRADSQHIEALAAQRSVAAAELRAATQTLQAEKASIQACLDSTMEAQKFWADQVQGLSNQLSDERAARKQEYDSCQAEIRRQRKQLTDWEQWKRNLAKPTTDQKPLPAVATGHAVDAGIAPAPPQPAMHSVAPATSTAVVASKSSDSSTKDTRPFIAGSSILFGARPTLGANCSRSARSMVQERASQGTALDDPNAPHGHHQSHIEPDTRHHFHLEDTASFAQISSPAYSFGPWTVDSLIYEEPRFERLMASPEETGGSTGSRREDNDSVTDERRLEEALGEVAARQLSEDEEKLKPAEGDASIDEPTQIPDSVAVESNLEPFIVEAQPVYPGNDPDVKDLPEEPPVDTKPEQVLPEQPQENLTTTTTTTEAPEKVSIEVSESQEPPKPTRGPFNSRKSVESNEVIASTPAPPPEVIEAAEKKRNQLLRRTKENVKDRLKPSPAEPRTPEKSQDIPQAPEVPRREPITRQKFAFKANDTARSTGPIRLRQGRKLKPDLQEEAKEDNSGDQGPDDDDLKKKLAKELAKLYKKELENRKNQLVSKDSPPQASPGSNEDAEPVQTKTITPKVSRPSPLTVHRGTAARLSRNQTSVLRQGRKLVADSTEAPTPALWTTTVLPPNVQKFQKIARLTKTRDLIEDSKRRKRLQNIIAPRGRYRGKNGAVSSEEKDVTLPKVSPVVLPEEPREQQSTSENEEPSLDEKRSCTKLKQGAIVCKVPKRKLGSRFATSQGAQTSLANAGRPIFNELGKSQEKPERARFVPKNSRRRPAKTEPTVVPNAVEVAEPLPTLSAHLEAPVITVHPEPNPGKLLVEVPGPPSIPQEHQFGVKHQFHEPGVQQQPHQHDIQHQLHQQEVQHQLHHNEVQQHQLHQQEVQHQLHQQEVQHSPHHNEVHHQFHQNEVQLSRPETHSQSHHESPHLHIELQKIHKPNVPFSNDHHGQVHHHPTHELQPPPFQILLEPQGPPTGEEHPQALNHHSHGNVRHEHHQQHQSEHEKGVHNRPDFQHEPETERPQQVFEPNYEGWEPLPPTTSPHHHNQPSHQFGFFGHHHHEQQQGVPFNSQHPQQRPRPQSQHRPQNHQIHIQHHRPPTSPHPERPFHVIHPQHPPPRPQQHREPVVNRPPQIPYFFPHPPRAFSYPVDSFFETLVESDEEESVPRETLRPPNFSRPRHKKNKDADDQSENTEAPPDVLTPVKEFVQKTPPGGIQPTPDTFYTIQGKGKNQWLEAHLAGKAGSKAAGNDLGVGQKHGFGASQQSSSDEKRLRPVDTVLDGKTYIPEYVEPLVIYYEEKNRNQAPPSTLFKKPKQSPYFEPELTQIGVDLSAVRRPQHGRHEPVQNSYNPETPSSTLQPPPHRRPPFGSDSSSARPFHISHEQGPSSHFGGQSHRPVQKDSEGRLRGPPENRPDFVPPPNLIRPNVKYAGGPQEATHEESAGGEHQSFLTPVHTIGTPPFQHQQSRHPHEEKHSEDFRRPVQPNIRHKATNLNLKHNDINYEGEENQRPLAIVTTERPFIGNSGETIIPHAVVVLQPAVESGLIQQPFKESGGQYTNKIRFTPEDAHGPGEFSKRPQAEAFRSPHDHEEIRRPSSYLRPPFPPRDQSPRLQPPRPFAGQDDKEDNQSFRHQPSLFQHTTPIPVSTTIYAPEGSPHAQSERPPLHFHIDQIPPGSTSSEEEVRANIVPFGRPHPNQEEHLLVQPAGPRRPHQPAIISQQSHFGQRPGDEGAGRPQQRPNTLVERPNIYQQQQDEEEDYQEPPPTREPYVDERPEPTFESGFRRPSVSQEEEDNFGRPHQVVTPTQQQRPNSIPLRNSEHQQNADGKIKRPHNQFGRPSQRPHHQQPPFHNPGQPREPQEPLGPRRPSARPHPGQERPSQLHPDELLVETTTSSSVYIEESPDYPRQNFARRPPHQQREPPLRRPNKQIQTGHHEEAERPRLLHPGPSGPPAEENTPPSSVYFEELPSPQHQRQNFSSRPLQSQQQSRRPDEEQPSQYRYNGQPIIPVTVPSFQVTPHPPTRHQNNQHHIRPTTYRPAINNRPIIKPPQQEEEKERYTATPAPNYFFREATTPLAPFFTKGHQQAAGLAPSPTPLRQVYDEPSVPHLGIPGIPGKDYPLFGDVPATSFSCSAHQYAGYYADTESRCQAFHFCYAPHKTSQSFLCPNGTLFNQKYFVCDWWYNVKCEEAERYFDRNANLFLPFQQTQKQNNLYRKERTPSGIYFEQEQLAQDSISGGNNNVGVVEETSLLKSIQDDEYIQRERIPSGNRHQEDQRSRNAEEDEGSSQGEDLLGSPNDPWPSFLLGQPISFSSIGGTTGDPWSVLKDSSGQGFVFGNSSKNEEGSESARVTFKESRSPKAEIRPK